MTFILTITKSYSNVYPNEHTNELNYLRLKFNTIEKVSEYINDLYEKTKEHCDRKLPINLNSKSWGWVLHTREYIPKYKWPSMREIKKLLRDKNDYDKIPRIQIEMYDVSLWLDAIK